jgi:phosphatidylinositol-3,4,5-trisphosphate 3-phosphatase and dual-specificity protein phosphatase PTEN
MKPFCANVIRWLDQNPKNVAVIHCKAGKGRTGTMIASILLHTGQYKTAKEALEYFGQKRTSDGKGKFLI